MTESTEGLSRAGVSIWLDDLSRELLDGDGLTRRIEDQNVVGMTTNPTIFASALAKGEAYDDQVRELAASGTDLTGSVFALTTSDVRRACDVFRPIYDSTRGFDGRVSIEVEPGLARETDSTVEEAKLLWAEVDRPNVMIKIPATAEGLDAITQVIAAGISVNVTLIFSLTRHREVINAYLTGLERARDAGIDLTTIHSVASFFVSRVDKEVDSRLTKIGGDQALALKGKAGVANARLAYQVYQEAFDSERARDLIASGANPQRPLWASTGVKDPSLPDTYYVANLIADGVVNTMPGKTLDASAGEEAFTDASDSVTPEYDDANAVLDGIAAVGISYDEVTQLLENEGVNKFLVSWNELLDTVTKALEAAK